MEYSMWPLAVTGFHTNVQMPTDQQVDICNSICILTTCDYLATYDPTLAASPDSVYNDTKFTMQVISSLVVHNPLLV